MEYADEPARRTIEATDDLGLDLAIVAADQPGQGAFADRQLVIGGADKAKARRLAAARPGDRASQRIAVGITGEAFDRHDLGQWRAGDELAAAGARQLARALDPAQHVAQRWLLRHSEPEGAGNLAGAKRARIGAQELDQRRR